jgi:hypothetical protein
MFAALQVANAYGCGLTDWDMSSLYGKLCIFAFAAWAGQNGGVIAGLGVCGVMLSVTSAAAGVSRAELLPLPAQGVLNGDVLFCVRASSKTSACLFASD